MVLRTPRPEVWPHSRRRIARFALLLFSATLLLSGFNSSTAASEKPFPSNLGGNFRYEQVDIMIPCPGFGLSITRTYNSQSRSQGVFGYGWHSELDQKLVFSSEKNQLYIVEADGKVLNFQHDGKGRIFFNRQAGWQTVERNADRSWNRTLKGGRKQTFDAQGNLLKMSDLNGNEVLVDYSPSHQVQRVTSSSGRALRFHYDGKGKIQRIEDPLGRICAYQIDEHGDLTHAVDPMGRAVLYRYDKFHNLMEVRYPDGTSKTLAYDVKNDLLLKENGPGTFQTTYSYDPVKLEVSVTDGNGRTTRLVYASDFKRKVILDPMGGETIQEFQEDGLLTLQRDPMGNETRYEYNDHGNLEAIMDPMVFRETLHYDLRFHLPISVTDKLGRQYELKYDRAGNPVSVIDPEKNELRNVYNKDGTLKETVDALGRRTQYQYNENGYLTKVYDELGSIFEATYDAVGQILKRTYPDGSWISFSYSPTGRIVSTTDSGTRTFRYMYDSMDRLTAVFDGGGRENRFAYDPRGYIVSTRNALGNQNRFDYDASGNLVQFTDASGNVTRFSYDSLNQLIQKTDAGGSRFEYTYDGAGRVVAYKDALGQTVKYQYDRLGQVIEKSYPDGGRTHFTYSPTGKLTAVQGSHTSLFYAYDRLDRMLSKQDNLIGQTLRYTYNPAGEVVEMAGPGAQTTKYAYDQRGRLAILTDPLERKTEYRYDEAGRRQFVQYPNGIKTRLEYDALGRLASIRHEDSSGKLLSSSEYELDQRDNRIRVRIDESLARIYGYDAENQLISETTAQDTIAYAYDPLGNRLEFRGPENSAYEYDRLNRLISSGKTRYAYDANGHLIQKAESGGVTRYRYDVDGNLTLVELPDGNKYEYQYDAMGNRISMGGPDGKKFYVYDREDLLAELSGDRRLGRTYIHGNGIDDLIGFIQGKDFYSVHGDGLGSTRVVADQKQTVRSRYDYSAFGLVTPIQEDIPLPFLFTGARYDAETSLHYLRTRAYDPKVGRFISPDTIGLAGGTNLYRYVQNNPLKYVDPYGEIMATTIGAVIGPIVGAGRAYMHHKSGPEIWAAATGGLVSGVICGVAVDLTIATGGVAAAGAVVAAPTTTAGVLASSGLAVVAAGGVGGAAGGVAGSATEQVLGNRYARGQRWGDAVANIKGDELRDAGIGGAVGGMMGGAATKILSPGFGQGVGTVAREASKTAEVVISGLVPELSDEVLSSTDPGTFGQPRREEREARSRSEGDKTKALAELELAETLIRGAQEFAKDAETKIQEVNTALASDNKARQASERAKGALLKAEKTVAPALDVCRAASNLNDMVAAKEDVLATVNEVRGSSERVEALVERACRTSALSAQENSDAGRDIRMKEARSLAGQAQDIVATHERIYERFNEKVSVVVAKEKERKAATEKARSVQGELNSAKETIEKALYDLIDLMESKGQSSRLYSWLDEARTDAQRAQSQKERALGILENIQTKLLANIEQPDRSEISSRMALCLSSAAMISIPSVEGVRKDLAQSQDEIRNLAQPVNQASTKIKEFDQRLKTCVEMGAREEIVRETMGAADSVSRYMQEMERMLARASDCAGLDTGFSLAGEGRTEQVADPAGTPERPEEGFASAGTGRTELGEQSPVLIPESLGQSPSFPSAEAGEETGGGFASAGVGQTRYGPAIPQPPQTAASAAGGLPANVSPLVVGPKPFRGDGQPAASHIFSACSRLGWAGGLCRYSVGPADQSIVDHIMTAGEHVMWANRESYPPIKAWPTWQNTKGEFKSWADQLARSRTDAYRRSLSESIHSKHYTLSSELAYQSVGTTEKHATCDEAYCRLGFEMAYGQQALMIADEAMRNGDKAAHDRARMDGMNHLRGASRILADYQAIPTASGRCADLRGIKEMVDAILRGGEIFSLARSATTAWTTASERIGNLASGGPSQPGKYDECLKKYCPECTQTVDLLGIAADPKCTDCKKKNEKLINECVSGMPAPVAQPSRPKPSAAPSRQEASQSRPRTDGYYRTRTGNKLGYQAFHLFVRFLGQGAVRTAYVRIGTSSEQYQVGNNFYNKLLTSEAQTNQGVSALQAVTTLGQWYESFDQTYQQQGDTIRLKGYFDGKGRLFQMRRCTDSLDFKLKDDGRAILALYNCFGKPIEDELVFVPHDWGR